MHGEVWCVVAPVRVRTDMYVMRVLLHRVLHVYINDMYVMRVLLHSRYINDTYVHNESFTSQSDARVHK